MNWHCFLAFVFSNTTLVFGASWGPHSAATAEDAARSHDPTSTTLLGERLLLFVESVPLGSRGSRSQVDRRGCSVRRSLFG